MELWLLFFALILLEVADVFSTWKLYALNPGKGFQETNPIYGWAEGMGISKLIMKVILLRVLLALLFFICLYFSTWNAKFIAVYTRVFYLLCGYCIGVVFCNILEIRILLKRKEN